MTTFCQLSDGHVPDGMAFAADGRLFVCTTISGGLTVLSPEGEVLEEIALGQHATNCIFDGSTLYVTATAVSDIHADQRTGTFWSVETDATGPAADPRPALATARAAGRRVPGTVPGTVPGSVPGTVPGPTPAAHESLRFRAPSDGIVTGCRLRSRARPPRRQCTVRLGWSSPSAAFTCGANRCSSSAASSSTEPVTMKEIARVIAVRNARS